MGNNEMDVNNQEQVISSKVHSLINPDQLWKTNIAVCIIDLEKTLVN